MRHPERERRRIQQLRRRRPELEELLDFLDRIAERAPGLIPDRFDTGRLPCAAPPTPLRPDAFPLDEDRAAEAFRTLVDAFPHDPDGEAARVRAALEGGRLDPRAACRAYLRGDGDHFLDLEERGTAPAALVAQLAELAVKPQFIAAARALGAVPSTIADRCPLCGSWPEVVLIVDREAAERAAQGVCRLCESEWPVRRVRCPACGNEDPETLSYLQAEGEEGARVNVCVACKTYVPVVDTRGRLEVAPAVERAALAHLDVAAERAGYQILSEIRFRSRLEQPTGSAEADGGARGEAGSS